MAAETKSALALLISVASTTKVESDEISNRPLITPSVEGNAVKVQGEVRAIFAFLTSSP